MAGRDRACSGLSEPSASFSSSRRFIYEFEHFNGVAELLEILGR